MDTNPQRDSATVMPGERRRIGDSLFRWGVAPLMAGCVRLLGRSLSMKVSPPERLRELLLSRRPVIFVFWHEDLFSIAVLHLRHNPGRAAVMVSRSRDGQKLSEIIEHLRLAPVRGSSSRGAVRGMIELVRWLQGRNGGRMAAIALDGPRGPRRQAKPGVALLARQTDALVVGLGFGYTRQWRFKSWDRTRLAKPFAGMECRISEPIEPGDWSDDPEQNRQRLETMLNSLAMD